MLSSKMNFQTIFCFQVFFFLICYSSLNMQLPFLSSHEFETYTRTLCCILLKRKLLWMKKKRIVTKKVSILGWETCWKRTKSQYAGSMSNQHSCPFPDTANNKKKKQYNLCTLKHLQDYDCIMKSFYSFLINTRKTLDAAVESGWIRIGISFMRKWNVNVTNLNGVL